jgi:hypothetical protein
VKMRKLLVSRSGIPEDKAKIEALIEVDRLMAGARCSTAGFKDYISALAPECCKCLKIGFKCRDMICLQVTVQQPKRVWESNTLSHTSVPTEVWRDMCK